MATAHFFYVLRTGVIPTDTSGLEMPDSDHGKRWQICPTVALHDSTNLNFRSDQALSYWKYISTMFYEQNVKLTKYWFIEKKFGWKPHFIYVSEGNSVNSRWIYTWLTMADETESWHCQPSLDYNSNWTNRARYDWLSPLSLSWRHHQLFACNWSKGQDSSFNFSKS